jgi:ribonuclease P protein component
MIVLPNEMDTSRVGVTASRSVGSAVERNRAKRLLREAARHLYPEFQSKSWDIMLVARPKLVNASEKEVEKALSALLERAGL